MNNLVAKVYLYLLALVTFLVLLFNFVSLTVSIPDYISPGSGWVTDFSSARNDLFMRKYTLWPDITKPEHVQKLAGIDEDEIQKFIEERQFEAIKQNRANSLRKIIRNALSFILLLPIHIYFFVLARKPQLKTSETKGS